MMRKMILGKNKNPLIWEGPKPKAPKQSAGALGQEEEARRKRKRERKKP
jgi:hypothetical protein